MKKSVIKQQHRAFQEQYPKMYTEEAEYALQHFEDAILTKNITFVVTENCNLRCTYCYECGKNQTKRMTKEVARKAVDTILDQTKLNKYIDFEKHKCPILEFIGGEPLLEIEIIDYIMDYFRYKTTIMNHPWRDKYMISITSNGMLYDDPKVQKFILKNMGRLSISITIDGDKQLHDSCRLTIDGNGSYDTVVKSVKHAIKQIGMKDTKVTFAPGNIRFINRSIKHLFDLGLTNIAANCVFENVWKKEDSIVFYDQLIQLADYMIDNEIYKYASVSIFDENIGRPMESADDRNWCGGDGQMLAIGTDGRLFPCIRFMQYSLSNPNTKEICIGDLDNGVKDRKEIPMFDCLCSITRSSQSTKECMECPVAQGCAWCTGYNYDVFGTPNKRATFICPMHKARVLASYYYFNKLAEKEEDYTTDFKLYLPEEDINYITQGKGIKRW